MRVPNFKLPDPDADFRRHQEWIAGHVFDAVAVELHGGKAPDDIRPAYAELYRLKVDHWVESGVMTDVEAESMVATVGAAMDRAFREYDPADPRFSEEAIEANRQALLRDPIHCLVRDDPERVAVVEHLREVGEALGFDPIEVSVVVFDYAHDPERYRSHVAGGGDVAEYFRLELERIEERIRLEDEKDLAGPVDEEELRDFPSPGDYRYQGRFRRPTLAWQETWAAVARYDLADSDMQQALARGRGADEATDPDVVRARLRLGEATRALCEVIRSQVDGCDEIHAVSVDGIIYVDASPGPDRYRIQVLVPGDNMVAVARPPRQEDEPARSPWAPGRRGTR